MIRDALAGKIDLIVTKSVSRFARNTVDSLTTIRKLKEAGCECFFQKENIMTFDSKGELLITIMSSLAQEESRSISENVTWGQRKRFSDGKVSIPYGQFLGYRKGADGLPEIVHGDVFRVQGKPEEPVRRKIYCVDRLAQMTLLETIPNSYMLAPAIPEHCIQRWNLVQLPCSDNQSLYLNALVYHKQYAMSEIEAGFVQFVREHKAFV